jgi:hypothetical protein
MTSIVLVAVISLLEANSIVAVTVYSYTLSSEGIPSGQLTLMHGVSFNPSGYVFSCTFTRSSRLYLSPSQLAPVLVLYVIDLVPFDTVYVIYLISAVYVVSSVVINRLLPIPFYHSAIISPDVLGSDNTPEGLE